MLSNSCYLHRLALQVSPAKWLCTEHCLKSGFPLTMQAFMCKASSTSSLCTAEDTAVNTVEADSPSCVHTLIKS